MMAPEKLILFEAEEKDLAGISKLVNSAYRGESSKKGWTTEADFLGGQRTDPETLRQDLMANPENRKFLCLRSLETGELCGSVFLERIQRENEVGCYLGMLTVDPNLQKFGIGKELLGAAENAAKMWGASKMTLTVIHVRAELMAWYERRGYLCTGEKKPFPYGNPKAGEPLRDDLYFVAYEKNL